MGSSVSKPRPGHERPVHLAKVGSPQSDAWGHETRLRRVFGPRWSRVTLALLVALVLVGLIGLTL
jgi:hypothetical protein